MYGGVQYCTVQQRTGVYSTEAYRPVHVHTGDKQYSSVEACTVQCSYVQYKTVQYGRVQAYRRVQWSTVQYSTGAYMRVQACSVE